MADISFTVPLAIGAGTFLVIVLIFWGLHLVNRQQARSRELLNKLRWARLESEFLGREEEPPADQAAGGRWRLLSFLGGLGRRMGPRESSAEYSRMRVRFLRAGLRRSTYPTLFWGAKCLLALILPAVFLLLRVSVLDVQKVNLLLWLALLLAMAGFYLPDLWLNLRIARRKRKIFEGIPDALDLLVVCVEAGMGLDAAMNRIAEEMIMANRPLSEELKIYNLEVRAGKHRQEALHNLSTRIDLDDFSSLVTLLIQTDKFGTSLAQALRIYSDTFRTKRYIKAEELAAKLPTKLMVPLILFIFPALFVVILGPAGIRIYQMITTF